MAADRKIVMIGATGAVGRHVAVTLAASPDVSRLTLLGRRPAPGLTGDHITQHTIDVFDAAVYPKQVAGHEVAICTLGVGSPATVSREDFIRIDKEAVLAFARACRDAGVVHFELLSSVGVDANSRSFYLRTKGELEDGLRALDFPRLSLFHPSMILTPTNRYGIVQAVTLAVWPMLRPFLVGPLRALRGVAVEDLGRAIALNVLLDKQGEEILRWDDFIAITRATS